MIALRDDLPLLARTGGTVTALSGAWLQRALERAASRAGYGEGWWPARDLARGVVHYLRFHYAETTIALARLRRAVCDVLRGIGYQEVARYFRPSPAPCRVDLARLAASGGGSGNGRGGGGDDGGGGNHHHDDATTAFFGRLAARLRVLRDTAATDDGTLQLHGLEECVVSLRSASGGEKPCPALLRARVVHFIRAELLALGWEGVRFAVL